MTKQVCALQVTWKLKTTFWPNSGSPFHPQHYNNTRKQMRKIPVTMGFHVLDIMESIK